MAIWDRWIRRKPRAKEAPPLDVAEVKREEKRMEIREAQLAAEHTKLERERERLFKEGAAEKAEPRRRTLARKLLETARRLRRCSQDHRRACKEALALARIRTVLEQARTPGNPLLERFDEVAALRMDGLLIDDRVTEEMYQEKLDALLGGRREALAAADPAPAPDPAAPAATEEDVLELWKKADAGDLPDFEDGMRALSP